MPARDTSPLPPLEDEDEQPIAKTVSAAEARLDAAAKRAQMNRMKRTEAALAAQPKVPVRVPKDTTVQINGVGFYIKGKTTVQVPQQVYDTLIQADRI